jgi:hypothetical protein
MKSLKVALFIIVITNSCSYSYEVSNTIKIDLNGQSKADSIRNAINKASLNAKPVSNPIVKQDDNIIYETTTDERTQ